MKERRYILIKDGGDHRAYDSMELKGTQGQQLSKTDSILNLVFSLNSLNNWLICKKTETFY